MNPPHPFTIAAGKPGGREWTLWTAAVLLSIPLIFRGYVGTLTRFASDDYCWPMLVSNQGFLKLQVHLYTESYGRWAASALVSLMSYAGNLMTPLLPGISIALCTAALAWFLYEISHKPIPSIVIAEIVFLAVITTTPRAALEPLYWQSAVLTYIPPFVIGPVGGALAIRFKSKVIAFLAACIACGFNEAMCMMVLCGLAVAIPFVDRNPDSGQSRRGYLFAALTGALLSTVLAAASPGNAIRRGGTMLMPDPLFLADSLRQTGELLWGIVRAPAGILLLVMGMGLAPYVGISRRVRPLWTAAVGLLLAFSAIAASIYGIKTLMARTAMVPTFSLVAVILILGFWAGGKFVPRSAVICLLCTVLFAAAAGSRSLSLLPVMQKYNRSWEARNKILEEAGPDERVILPPANNPFTDAWHIEADPNWPINQCVASYYGVASVQTKASSKAKRAKRPRK